MKCPIVLIASLILIPLAAGQATDKPSPIPARSRKSVSTSKATGKSSSAHANSSSEPLAKAPRTTTAEPAAGELEKETGKASYFTSSMDGSPTASGEPANSGDLVAAHASYPLGSRVLVTNLANGKSVEVRIVDRIPKGPRVINLSESAARQLDFVKAGTAEVSLQPVQK